MLIEKSTIGKLRVSGKAETLQKSRKDRKGKIRYGLTLETATAMAARESALFLSLVTVTEEIYHSTEVGDQVHLILFKED